MDFNLRTYIHLLKSLRSQGFLFYTFETYIRLIKSGLLTGNEKFIILRHDVDLKPQNSLIFARIQAKMNISGTYYFRILPKSFHVDIIREIASLGHEIGYHYETMDTCKGNIENAYREFCTNLEVFRSIVPIYTIAMHGSPLSKFDNRTLWEKYDYKTLGLIGEPYFDLDFNDVFYLTDTGRRWDGHLFNIRDRAPSNNPCTNPYFLKLRFRSTHEIIDAIDRGLFPSRAMLNFHPQRWSDNLLDWSIEWVGQTFKNQIKRILVFQRDFKIA